MDHAADIRICPACRSMYLVTVANGIVVMLDDDPCETCIKRSEGIAPVPGATRS